jgi:hypothetical protein
MEMETDDILWCVLCYGYFVDHVDNMADVRIHNSGWVLAVHMWLHGDLDEL